MQHKLWDPGREESGVSQTTLCQGHRCNEHSSSKSLPDQMKPVSDCLCFFFLASAVVSARFCGDLDTACMLICSRQCTNLRSSLNSACMEESRISRLSASAISLTHDGLHRIAINAVARRLPGLSSGNQESSCSRFSAGFESLKEYCDSES
jgi:hypothetical protein